MTKFRKGLACKQYVKGHTIPILSIRDTRTIHQMIDFPNVTRTSEHPTYDIPVLYLVIVRDHFIDSINHVFDEESSATNLRR